MNIVEYRKELDRASNNLKDNVAKAYAVFAEHVDEAYSSFFSDPAEENVSRDKHTRNGEYSNG